jgi:hypothetical protein
MTAPLFITTEKRSGSLPILVVDKQGIFSKGLVSMLSEHFTIVLVSARHSLPHLERVTYISFRRNIPEIPDDYYAGIILFYNGEDALRDGLSSFIKKAKQNNAKLIIVTSRDLSHTNAFHKAIEQYEEAHLLIYGDIFGISAHEISLPTHMVQEAVKTGKISVNGSGLSETYPVYYADMLQGILQVLLSHGGSKVGYLYPTTPIPQIHLARLITKMFPQASIMFIGRESERKGVKVPEGDVLVDDPYPLGKKLKHLTEFSKSDMAATRPQKTTRQKPKYLPFLLTSLVVLCFLPFLTLLFFLIGLFSLRVAGNAAKSGDLPVVIKRSENAQLFFTAAHRSSGMLRALSVPVGLSGVVDTYLTQITTGQTVASVAWEIGQAGLVYQPLGGKQPGVSRDRMLQTSSHVKQAILGLGALQADDSFPQSYKADLLKIQRPLLRLSGIIEHLPYLLGAGQEKTYLVLFQNNMELRPGGGFIGSYGLLRLKDGMIASFSVHDVYDADGQLKTHVEPPVALQRYLGVSHLFLRDSNFDLEFAKNAALAASLLNLSTKERVDGVITLDVSVLRSLLRVVGPVYLPEYNETVNAETFYLSAQTHAEKDFFPGSTQKKDFLQHVAQAILHSLEERGSKPYLDLLTTLDRGLAEKHIMVASADAGIMRILSQNGFAPSLTLTQTERISALPDFLGVFSANLGANKADYYLKRSFSQTIMLRADGSREEELTMQFTNTSTPKSPFGGEYKNFQQLVLPETAEIAGIRFDGEEQVLTPAVTSVRVFTSEGFAPPVGLELSRDVLYGRSVYGFPVTVPAGGKRIVTVTYTVPPVPLPDRFSYLLRVYKQPGTDFDPYRLTFRYDPAFRLLSAPGFASQTEGTLRVSRELSVDILLPVEFIKQ